MKRPQVEQMKSSMRAAFPRADMWRPLAVALDALYPTLSDAKLVQVPGPVDALAGVETSTGFAMAAFVATQGASVGNGIRSGFGRK